MNSALFSDHLNTVQGHPAVLRHGQGDQDAHRVPGQDAADLPQGTVPGERKYIIYLDDRLHELQSGLWRLEL